MCLVSPAAISSHPSVWLVALTFSRTGTSQRALSDIFPAPITHPEQTSWEAFFFSSPQLSDFFFPASSCLCTPAPWWLGSAAGASRLSARDGLLPSLPPKTHSLQFSPVHLSPAHCQLQAPGHFFLLEVRSRCLAHCRAWKGWWWKALLQFYSVRFSAPHVYTDKCNERFRTEQFRLRSRHLNLLD